MISETRHSFSMHGITNFGLVGEGPLFEYLCYQYKDFVSDSVNKQKMERDFEVKVAAQKAAQDIEHALNNGNETYAISKDRSEFIWTVSNKTARLNGHERLVDQKGILFEPSFNKMKANLLCELFWRLKFAADDVALVHAACVARGEQTILLPAWKSVGKTAVCLKLVGAGSDYLADDRVWLKADGVALSFPRYVVLKDSNVMHFPEMTGRKTKIVFRFCNALAKVGGLEDKNTFKRIRRKLIPAKYYRLSELYPSAKTREKSRVTSTIQLTKRQNLNEVQLLTSRSDATARIVSNIGDVEWNHPLLTLASAHDILFPDGPQWADELKNLMNREKKIIKEAIASTSCSVLHLPNDASFLNWHLVQQKLFGR